MTSAVHKKIGKGRCTELERAKKIATEVYEDDDDEENDDDAPQLVAVATSSS